MTRKIISAALLSVAVVATPAQALKINLIDSGGVTGSKANRGFQIAAKYWNQKRV